MNRITWGGLAHPSGHLMPAGDLLYCINSVRRLTDRSQASAWRSTAAALKQRCALQHPLAPSSCALPLINLLIRGPSMWLSSMRRRRRRTCAQSCTRQVRSRNVCGCASQGGKMARIRAAQGPSPTRPSPAEPGKPWCTHLKEGADGERRGPHSWGRAHTAATAAAAGGSTSTCLVRHRGSAALMAPQARKRTQGIPSLGCPGSSSILLELVRAEVADAELGAISTAACKA